MFYRPQDGHGLPHNPFKAIVAPRPIGWISSRSAGGIDNLAPYSFFNAVSDQPPIVMFSSGGWKDSARNARDSGVFAVSFVTLALADAMNRSSAIHGRDISEFAVEAIASEPCRTIACLRPAEAPATLECRVTEIIVPKDAEGADTSNILVFGQVIGIHIDDKALHDGRFDPAAAGYVSRLGYMDYAALQPSFALKRPERP